MAFTMIALSKFQPPSTNSICLYYYEYIRALQEAI
jgi:hypothetical protein